MNIENIKALAAQLQAIGVKDTAPALLKRICFRPEFFVLEQKLTKGSDTISVQCFVQKVESSTDYVLRFYDAILVSDASLPEEDVNGISVHLLDEQMQNIDWKKANEPDGATNIVLDDKRTWERESGIATIIASLQRLEETDKGKPLGALLKRRHWSGLSLTTLFGTAATSREKGDIHQRFYLRENHQIISVDEAWRFLQNKRWEKQMQNNRHFGSSESSDEANKDNADSSDVTRHQGKAGRTREGSKRNFKRKTNK